MKKLIFISLILFSIFLLWCNSTKKTNINDVANVWENGLSEWEIMIDGEVYAWEELQNKMIEEQFEWVDEDYKLVREIEDLEDLKKSGTRAKRSCNAIAEYSTCIEYYWSFWTKEMVEVGCDWNFSNKACPWDMAGWCNTAMWTEADMVAWMYTYWWGEMNSESIKYAKMACEATMWSKWIQ